MGSFDRLLRAGAIAFAAGVACVPLLSEVDRPCPCAAGFICCETTHTCRKKNECPQSRTDSDASHGASMDGGPDASFASSRGADDRDVSSPPDDGNHPDVPDALYWLYAPDAPDAPVDGSVEPDASTDAIVERDAPPEAPIVPPVGCWSEPRKSNVLVLVYNPYLVTRGHSLRDEIAAWIDPPLLSVRIAEHVRMGSHGLINYDVVEFREINAWPKQMPGAAPLDEMTFLNGIPPSPDGSSYTDYEGGNADHGDIFDSQNLCNYLTANDVSEVWLWGAVGMYQSFGFDSFAYRLTGDVLPNRAPTVADWNLYTRRRKNLPDCGRSVWVLGFSYPGYGYDPRLYTMRIEEILNLSLRGMSADGGDVEDIFSRFRHSALTSPNDVQVGMSDYPPNGGVGLPPEQQPSNYDNHSIVQSGADDWYGYPTLTGTQKPVDCTAWGCTNVGFQAWYTAHIPRAAGGSIERGCNNWWKYIADPDGRLAPCSGADCSPEYAVGQSCTADDQCVSHHCACQGSRMLCSDAAGPICGNANWDLCLFDDDCLSGVCGCNEGPPPKQCLPGPQYPRACSSP